MNQSELFDIVELLVDLSENLQIGIKGTIAERYGDDAYEVEFSDSNGETLELCTLSPKQFIIVWQAKTKSWLSLSDRIADVVKKLDAARQKEVFKFARSLQS